MNVNQQQKTKALRVLCVDDDVTAQHIYRHGFAKFLKPADQLDVATTACEALEIIENNFIDVLVLDLRLPDLSGLEVLRTVKQISRETEVIILTGKGSVTNTLETMRYGARDFLEKPINIPLLAQKVEYIRQFKQTQEQLRFAESRLEGTNDNLKEHERYRALSQMAGGIAHDFNNSLVTIIGLVDLMLEFPQRLDDKARVTKDLKVIQSAAENASATIRRMREFYRPTEEDEYEAVDVAKLFQDVLDSTKPKWHNQVQQKGICIDTELDLQLQQTIPGKRSEIYETLTNLVFNAVEAMPEGGTITLRARQQEEWAVLSVMDTGKGMQPDVLERCTEPFFTTRGTEGTGIGLAMVRGIVERHAGEMKIWSQPGQGTVIHLYLPLVQSEPRRIDPSVNQKPLKETSDETDANAVSLQVLLIEQGEEQRAVIRDALQQSGHRVAVAESGKVGLAKFSPARHQVVITSRTLGDMNGDRLGEVIKRMSPTTPVILLTGFADMMHATGDQPEIFDQVLSKPVTCEQLSHALTKVFKQRELIS